MSLKSKIEAVIYASEEPVTLVQLVTLLSEEVQVELEALAARQQDLPLEAALTPSAEEQFVGIDDPGVSPVEQSPTADPDTLSVADHSAPMDLVTNAGPAAGDGEAEQPDAAVADAAKRKARERERSVREYLRKTVDELMRDYADNDRGLEIREVAGGFRFGTKPEYHDAVRGFVRSLKPALKLTLQALETLAVVAYKQPVTAAEISEIRGVDSAGVLGGLLTRKLIQTAGRKQVIGRPMLYKTTKEFLVRFGLRDVQELPSMEEFERMAGELTEQEDLPMEDTEAIVERANARGDAEHIQAEAGSSSASSPAAEAGEQAGEVEQQAPAATEADEATAEQPGEPGAQQDAPANRADSSAAAESHSSAQDLA